MAWRCGRPAPRASASSGGGRCSSCRATRCRACAPTTSSRAERDLTRLSGEVVPLAATLGRVLAEDVVAPLYVPSFDRSNVDGFAVRAADTFGASEDRPLALRLNAETLATGVHPRQAVEAGTATALATGAMLPRGADAVVMVEHTDVRDGRLLLQRPAAPGANITFAGTDIGM